MKRLKLLFLGLCLAVISAQAQVVFSEAEKNFVVSRDYTNTGCSDHVYYQS